MFGARSLSSPVQLSVWQAHRSYLMHWPPPHPRLWCRCWTRVTSMFWSPVTHKLNMKFLRDLTRKQAFRNLDQKPVCNPAALAPSARQSLPLRMRLCNGFSFKAGAKAWQRSAVWFPAVRRFFKLRTVHGYESFSCKGPRNDKRVPKVTTTQSI